MFKSPLTAIESAIAAPTTVPVTTPTAPHSHARTFCGRIRSAEFRSVLAFRKSVSHSQTAQTHHSFPQQRPAQCQRTNSPTPCARLISTRFGEAGWSGVTAESEPRTSRPSGALPERVKSQPFSLSRASPRTRRGPVILLQSCDSLFERRNLLQFVLRAWPIWA